MRFLLSENKSPGWSLFCGSSRGFCVLDISFSAQNIPNITHDLLQFFKLPSSVERQEKYNVSDEATKNNLYE
jgi:hypothetical protein